MTQARGGALIPWLVAGGWSAPLCVFVAAMGARGGLWSADLALDRLTFQLAPALAGVGVVCGLVLAAKAARRPRALGLLAAATLVAASGTAAGLALRWDDFRGTAGWDVATDVADPPGFSRLLAQRRAADGADAANAPVGTADCPGASAAPTQAAPEAARRALEQAGFAVIGTAPFRAEGERSGFWFGVTHDAVIRIRPGRTDVRVTSRSGRADGGEACRLATALSRSLAADQAAGR